MAQQNSVAEIIVYGTDPVPAVDRRPGRGLRPPAGNRALPHPREISAERNAPADRILGQQGQGARDGRSDRDQQLLAGRPGRLYRLPDAVIKEAREQRKQSAEDTIRPIMSEPAGAAPGSSRLQGRAQHDRCRSHARPRAGRPQRPRLPRPPQGPRLSRLHRGVRALFLLFHADAARALHGQLSASAGAHRERTVSPGSGRWHYPGTRRPAALVRDFRRLHVAGLSDADPRRNHRRQADGPEDRLDRRRRW